MKREYQEFIQVSEESPPSALTAKIFAQVHADLHPSWSTVNQVFFKFLGIYNYSKNVVFLCFRKYSLKAPFPLVFDRAIFRKNSKIEPFLAFF